MDLLSEKLWFKKTDKGRNDTNGEANIAYTAVTPLHTYEVVVKDNLHVFYVNFKNQLNLTTWNWEPNGKAFYVFCYHISANSVVQRSIAGLTKRGDLNSYDQMLLERNVLSQFLPFLNVTKWSEKPPLQKSSRTVKPVKLKLKRTVLIEMLKQKKKRETETEHPQPPLFPSNLSLSGKRFNLLMNTISLKEKVLKHSHLLKREERLTFREIWVDFESFMSGADNWQDALAKGEETFTLNKLHAYHNALSELYANSIDAQAESSSNLDIQLLLSDINNLEQTIRGQAYRLDVMGLHQFEKILEDSVSLITSYNDLPVGRKEPWLPNVIDGLNETIHKLTDILSVASEDAERAVKRQLILLRER